MLKRGGKSSYNPYSTAQRMKKGRDRLDILPNKHSVWLKQVRLALWQSAEWVDGVVFLVRSRETK